MDPSLDPNHTHFIIVDDGTENKHDKSIIKFRSKLEACVSEMKTIGGDSRFSFCFFSIDLCHTFFAFVMQFSDLYLHLCTNKRHTHIPNPRGLYHRVRNICN